MLIGIETNDGRLLVTDKEDIESVIKEAQEDMVDIVDFGDKSFDMSFLFESNRSYILISNGDIKVDEACRP
jgi:hypothetical protein